MAETQNLGENTEHSSDVVRLVQSLARFIDEAGADGKFDMQDGFKALGLFPEAAAAIKGIELIPGELSKMNGEQKDAIIVAFGLAVRNLVEASIRIAKK